MLIKKKTRTSLPDRRSCGVVSELKNGTVASKQLFAPDTRVNRGCGRTSQSPGEAEQDLNPFDVLVCFVFRGHCGLAALSRVTDKGYVVRKACCIRACLIRTWQLERAEGAECAGRRVLTTKYAV